MNEQKQDSRRTPANQGVRDVTPEPNKIGASTPYDFEAKNLTAYGGLLPVATMLEKLGFQQLVEETLTVKRKTKAMTMYQFVLAMVLACYVGFSRLYPFALPGTGADADRNPGGAAPAAAIDLLALPGLAAPGRGAATAPGAAADARAGLGGRQRPIDGSDPGHRHHRAHPVRQPDGGAQELQPEEQGQEELPADPDLSGRNQGVRGRRAAHRRPAQREGNRRASGQRLRRPAGHGEDRLRARRFRLLLLGGGPGV